MANKCTTQLVGPPKMGRIAGVSGQTVRNWERLGIIAAEYKIGRTIRFDPERVMRQLAAPSKTRTEDGVDRVAK